VSGRALNDLIVRKGMAGVGIPYKTTFQNSRCVGTRDERDYQRYHCLGAVPSGNNPALLLILLLKIIAQIHVRTGQKQV
jgi:hypothetical protein